MRACGPVILAAVTALSAAGVTVDVTPGSMGPEVTVSPDETELEVRGIVDASDLRYIASSCRRLHKLDLSAAKIAAYGGGRHIPPHGSDTLPEGCLAGLCASVVILPHSVKAIGACALMSAGVEKIVIPAGVVSVGAGAFADCRSLREVVVEGFETRVGAYAFSGCEALESVEYRAAEVGEWCFSRCRQLKRVSLADSVSLISDGAFAGCVSLVRLEMPSSLSAIGADAFAGSGVREVDLSHTSLTGIADRAFSGCESLTAVSLPASLTSMGEGVFADSRSLRSITLPDGLNDIPPLAFKGLEYVSDVTPLLPASVRYIGAYAFADMPALSVADMPERLDFIGDGAFAGCTALDSIYAESLCAVPALGADVWEGVSQPDVTLLVAGDMADAYLSAQQWREFHITTRAQSKYDSPGRKGNVEAVFDSENLLVRATETITGVAVYDFEGRSVARMSHGVSTMAEVVVTSASGSMFIIEITLADGGKTTMKLRR